jgi:hypothetical protein
MLSLIALASSLSLSPRNASLRMEASDCSQDWWDTLSDYCTPQLADSSSCVVFVHDEWLSCSISEFRWFDCTSSDCTIRVDLNAPSKTCEIYCRDDDALIAMIVICGAAVAVGVPVLVCWGKRACCFNPEWIALGGKTEGAGGAAGTASPPAWSEPGLNAPGAAPPLYGQGPPP